VQGLTPRGGFFDDQTLHFETLRNAGYTLSSCADFGDVLETAKLVTARSAHLTVVPPFAVHTGLTFALFVYATASRTMSVR
jgi:hypothetical protein